MSHSSTVMCPCIQQIVNSMISFYRSKNSYSAFKYYLIVVDLPYFHCDVALNLIVNSMMACRKKKQIYSAFKYYRSAVNMLIVDHVDSDPSCVRRDSKSGVLDVVDYKSEA